jgi:hypothetical protein
MLCRSGSEQLVTRRLHVLSYIHVYSKYHHDNRNLRRLTDHRGISHEWTTSKAVTLANVAIARCVRKSDHFIEERKKIIEHQLPLDSDIPNPVTAKEMLH